MKSVKNLSAKQQIRSSLSMEKLLTIENLLNKYGINIYNEETGKLRDWSDIIEDIGNKWDEIPND